jgi:hypothetical protein
VDQTEAGAHPAIGCHACPFPASGRYPAPHLCRTPPCEAVSGFVSSFVVELCVWAVLDAPALHVTPVRAISHLERSLLGCSCMYRCHLCKVCVPPRTPATRIPLELRERHYPPRPDAHQVRRNGKLVAVDDPGGVGTEIVREVIVCPSCATQHRPETVPVQSVERPAETSGGPARQPEEVPHR